MRHKTPTDLMLRVAVYFSAWVSLWFLFGSATRFHGHVYDTLQKVDHFLPGEWRMRAYGILLTAIGTVALFAFVIRTQKAILENCLLLLGVWWLYFGLVSAVQLAVYSDGPPISAGWGIFTAIAYYTLARRVALGQ